MLVKLKDYPQYPVGYFYTYVSRRFNTYGEVKSIASINRSHPLCNKTIQHLPPPLSLALFPYPVGCVLHPLIHTMQSCQKYIYIPNIERACFSSRTTDTDNARAYRGQRHKTGKLYNPSRKPPNVNEVQRVDKYFYKPDDEASSDWFNDITLEGAWSICELSSVCTSAAPTLNLERKSP